MLAEPCARCVGIRLVCCDGGDSVLERKCCALWLGDPSFCCTPLWVLGTIESRSRVLTGGDAYHRDRVRVQRGYRNQQSSAKPDESRRRVRDQSGKHSQGVRPAASDTYGTNSVNALAHYVRTTATVGFFLRTNHATTTRTSTMRKPK